MQLRWAIPSALLLLLSASAKAGDAVVPANPTARDAVQVPLSSVGYDRGTGLAEYALGVGHNWGNWVFGGTVRYHEVDKSEDQLLHARGPADATQLELVFGNAGNLFSKVTLADVCARQGMKSEDCVFSDLDADTQELYRKEGPDVDAPLVMLLTVGASYQALTMRSLSDPSFEQPQQMWGARARLGIGSYLDDSLLGLSVGAATLGAPPAQVSLCSAVNSTSSALACVPTYLDSYNRTSVVDARVEWREAVAQFRRSVALATNPSVQVVLQKSRRDDPQTKNNDTAFGLRYLDVELPFYFYFHRRDEPGIYAGMRGTIRWWLVDRGAQAELMAGFFLSAVYGGARKQLIRDRDPEPRFEFGQCDRCTTGSSR